MASKPHRDCVQLPGADESQFCGAPGGFFGQVVEGDGQAALNGGLRLNRLTEAQAVAGADDAAALFQQCRGERENGGGVFVLQT